MATFGDRYIYFKQDHSTETKFTAGAEFNIGGSYSYNGDNAPKFGFILNDGLPVVKQAMNTNTGTFVALKFYYTQEMKIEDRKEISIRLFTFQDLRHPYILNYDDISRESNDYFYLVSDWCDGGSLLTTISNFGPTLLSYVLELNDVQSDVINVLFKIADEAGLLLIDLKDLKAMLSFMEEHNNDLKDKYGNISKASISKEARSLQQT